jgi:DNA polymerase-3 subunit delta'
MASLQVFIIGDAETLVPQESSPEAANSLLKLLEEPPDSTRFILTSSEPGRLLPTVRSRCLPLHLAPLPRDEVRRFLVQEAGVGEAEAARAAGLSQGSIGRALGFVSLDGEAPLEELRDRALGLVEAAAGGHSPFATALGFRSAGARGLLELFSFVEEWLRDIAAVSAGSPDAVLNRDRA